MPTDAELRTLFRGASAPEARIDAAAVIRRSKRRRLPAQLGAGSVLTLAVAGISVAGISGLQALTPRTASDLAADAPTAVSEGAPFVGADGRASENLPACSSEVPGDAIAADGLSLAASFPATVPPGQPAVGSLILANTGVEAVAATIVDARVTVSGASATAQSSVQWHSDPSVAGTRVELVPGQSTTLDFTFDAIDCAGGTPLEPGEYRVSAVLNLLPDHDGPVPVRGLSSNGAARVVGGEASVITVR